MWQESSLRDSYQQLIRCQLVNVIVTLSTLNLRHSWEPPNSYRLRVSLLYQMYPEGIARAQVEPEQEPQVVPRGPCVIPLMFVISL